MLLWIGNLGMGASPAEGGVSARLARLTRPTFITLVTRCT